MANFNSNTVSVIIGNGTGAFGPKVDFATGPGPGSLAIGDLNGDGRADLAVTNLNSSSVSVLLYGGGTFGPKTDYTTGVSAYSVTIGDLANSS